MTEEEAKQVAQQLRDAGIDTGSWFDLQEGQVRIKSLESQRKLLTSLKETLQASLEDDLRAVQKMQEQLIRARHGGGQ